MYTKSVQKGVNVIYERTTCPRLYAPCSMPHALYSILTSLANKMAVTLGSNLYLSFNLPD